MYVCVCVCVCVCIGKYVYIYMYINIHIYIHSYIHTYIHILNLTYTTHINTCRIHMESRIEALHLQLASQTELLRSALAPPSRT
jgi:hypothetical protein